MSHQLTLTTSFGTLASTHCHCVYSLEPEPFHLTDTLLDAKHWKLMVELRAKLVWVKLFTICSHFLTSAGLKGTGVGTASKAAKEIWVGYTPWKSGLTGFLWKQQPDFCGTYGEGMNLRTKLRRGNQNVSSHVRNGEQVGIGCFRLQCRQEFVGKDFNCWLWRTAMMTHGLFKYRDSPGFTVHHEEVVTDASSVLLSLPRHEKICKRLYLLPTHPQQKDSFYWQNLLTGVG